MATPPLRSREENETSYLRGGARQLTLPCACLISRLGFGSEDARAVLQGLAKGTPEALETQAAKVSLDRLAKTERSEPGSLNAPHRSRGRGSVRSQSSSIGKSNLLLYPERSATAMTLCASSRNR